MKLELTPKQEELREVIKENLAIAKDWQNQEDAVVDKAFSAMKSAAHELHMQLEPKPKHHGYMIKNRGLEPEDPEFYNHIHPVEDLLDYLEDTTANDDPEDVTIGDTFHFDVYSQRWGHKDRYQLTRTKNGWYVSAVSYNGEDRVHEGMKELCRAMQHDSISYPRNVDSFMDSIWEQARDQGLTHEHVQEMLNKVADWISQTEQNAPRDVLL